MIIECDSCEVRGHACGDCVIGVLLGTPVPRTSDVDGDVNAAVGMPSGAPIVQLDAPEQRAFDVLAEQGLVPRLRLVSTRMHRATPEESGGQSTRDVG